MVNKDEQNKQNVESQAAEETVIVNAQTEPEADTAPAEDKVFGMPRRVFQGTALGIALGFIVQGALGAAGLHWDGMTIIIICGGIGWFVTKKLLEKQQAAENAAMQPIEIEADEKK